VIAAVAVRLMVKAIAALRGEAVDFIMSDGDE